MGPGPIAETPGNLAFQGHPFVHRNVFGPDDDSLVGAHFQGLKAVLFQIFWETDFVHINTDLFHVFAQITSPLQ